MNRQEREIINRKNGAFTRVIYKTDLTKDVKSEYRKQGYRIEKITSTTVRVGCAYENMKSVIARRETGDVPNPNRRNPYTWLIPNKIKEHENGTKYVVLDTCKNSNTRTKYIVIKGDEPSIKYEMDDEIKELLIPSYGHNPRKPEVITIKMDNLLEFNGVAK